MKYTDEQIKKALEICSAQDFDNINRQEAEIERLQRILNSYALQYGTAVDKNVLLKQAKSEAIKEFAERLKGIVECDIALTGEETKYLLVRIDEEAKEMVGGSK